MCMLNNSNNLGEFIQRVTKDLNISNMSCNDALKEIVHNSAPIHDANGKITKTYFCVAGVDYYATEDGIYTYKGLVDPCIIKGGRYIGITIGGKSLSYHRLMFVLFNPQLINYIDIPDYNINHTVLVKDKDSLGRDAKSRVINNPYEINPRYLELVTVSENNSHARFITEFGLEMIHVSARDINELYDKLLPLDYKEGSESLIRKYNRNIVEHYYKKKNFNGRVSFVA